METIPSSTTLDIPKRGMPVTIITGFLGSGKTTLLNEILSNKQDLKVAVLVNEFGDINIDAQLLISTEEDMVELSNGCICCTINDGLVDAVYRVLEREERVDYMVIETTGVADPLPIILTFLGTELREFTRLDSIITLVDAEAFTPEHFDSEAALKQIVYGDVVLLNKTDLAAPEQVEEVEAYIQTVKPGARILRTQQAKVPLPLVLDVGLTPVELYQAEEEHHEHEHHHHHSPHLDNDGFISVSFQSHSPFDIEKFEKFLTEEMPIEVFRAKGILWFDNSEMRHIFQLSGPRYDIQVEEWINSPQNQIVFIGRHLDSHKIRQQLQNCLILQPTQLAQAIGVKSF
ncbi:GTP-binding protein [Limnoraphis robusta Tam1]|uniref:CobW family GTP-binding protein n=1 Tax=Limnoraphis robusta TaxID=1118279 RepID=UPI002B218FD0|nr:GTP-binding protein [Limnoraphis robusta]MEA5496194.1 GTP-binding protein [Limnoraphis robusta BA-68 BA1]MEA5538496.1 GTP-binding protein [Limnoraphis robusta Tam1]